MPYEAYFLLVFLMCLSYFLVCCWSGHRTYRIQQFSGVWGPANFFYISILLQSLTRVFTFAFMSWNFPADRMASNYFFMLISIPDCIFFITYGLLVFRMLTVFYFCHMEKIVLLSILGRVSKTKHRTMLVVIAGILGVWVVYIGLLYFLMFYGKISQRLIRLQICLFNIIVGGAVLYVLTYCFSSYLHTPFKSNTGRAKLLRLSKIVIIFTLGRFYKGTIGLLELDVSSSLLIDIYQLENSSFLAALILATTYFISEILAFSLVLDYGFIYIFLFPEEEFLQFSGLYHRRRISSEAEEETSIRSLAISERSNPILDSADIENLTVFNSRPGGLGKLFLGAYKGEEIMYREIKLPRISGYLLEKFKKEIMLIRKIDIESLVPVLGTIFNLPMICIVSKYQRNLSLFRYIHRNVPIDYDVKLKLIEKVVGAVRDLHLRHKFHGHLSSHNLLFDGDGSLKISDFGMDKIKKYAEINAGYCNKSAWTSPEQLRLDRNIARNPQAYDDIYSLGVILWEILTQKIPHQDLSLPQIKEISKKLMPLELPKPSNWLGKLIKGCLHRDKYKRPDIKTISRVLQILHQ